MPMPQVADNSIFQPGSGFFSWQKIIDANKDQSKKVGEEYNKSLDNQAKEAQKKQTGVQRGLNAVQADIDKTKENVAQYVNSGLRGPENQDARQHIGQVAREGYKFDPSQMQQTINSVAKTQADLKAARSIAGRMGLQSNKLPTQAGLMDQMFLAQGGAGQNADFLAENLGTTNDLLRQQLGQTSTNAAGLQKDVTGQLTDYIKNQSDPARKSAIAKGKELLTANLEQAKNMGLANTFGDPAAYANAGIDLNRYVDVPDINQIPEGDLLSYGADQSDDYQALQDTYAMLGLDPIRLEGPKNYSLGYNVGGAKSALDLVNARKRGGREVGFELSEEQKRFLEDQKRKEFSKRKDEKDQWNKETGMGFPSLLEKQKNW